MSLNRIASLLALPVCFLGACATDLETSAAPGGKHCVSTASGDATCYATFTEAIAAATDGRITDAPADAADAVGDDTFTARLNGLATARSGPKASSVVIGIVYKDAHYQGGSTWVFSQPHGCDGNYNTSFRDFEVGNLNAWPYSDFGFNDAISSFHSYSGCRTVLFEDWHWLGAASWGGTPLADMDYVGDALNDRASSIAWY
jgi:hypothetical protein